MNRSPANSPVRLPLVLAILGLFFSDLAHADCLTPPAGLVGWWKGDGSTLDSISANNGVNQNITYANGVVGQAFACDPQNHAYGTYTGIQIADQPAYALTNSLTIESWVRPRGDGYIIFFRGDHRPGLDPYFLSMNGNSNLNFYITDPDGNYVHVETPLPYFEWTHVAATLDGGSGAMSIYTNGVLAVQTITSSRPYANLLPDQSPGVGIGNLNDGGNNFPFLGDIDEIGLYNRALAVVEIQAIYQAGSAGKCVPVCTPPPSGLVSWWPGEGNANDIVGGNNGALLDGTGYANGEAGQAFAFNDASAAVVVPASPSLAVGSGEGFTLEAWIKPTEVTLNHPLFEWNNAIYWGVHFHIAPGQPTSGSPGPAGPGQLYANIVDASGGWHQLGSAAGAVAAGVFQHVALTYDRASGVATIYCNGEIVSQQNLGSFTPLTTYDLYLGRRPAPGGEAGSFAGLMDEPAVYNRALSPAEIQAIHSAGSAGKCVGSFAPGITVPPLAQTAAAGSNVVLSVTASGTGPLNYQWKFNGASLAGATNATLVLTNLHPYQAGTYAVTVSSPYGSTTSSNAVITVLARNILIYKYSGFEKITAAGATVSNAYAGQFFFLPDTTNGVFIGWSQLKGEKTYWVNPLAGYLFFSISGAGGQTFTVLGQAGQEVDEHGHPHLWSDLHKGQNTRLNIGKKQYFSFPNTFADTATHIYPDPQTGQMILNEASSTYTFLSKDTQAANNNGKTLTDLVNALTKALANQGYAE